METRLDQDAYTRVRLAFLFLFVCVVALWVGAHFITSLSKVQEIHATRESLAALQGITGTEQIDEALRRHPSNKLLQMIAMATRAANETSAAAERLLNEAETPALSKDVDLGTAGRRDLEALQRDLKAAEASVATFMPRYLAIVKTERDKVETYAVSLHAEKDLVGSFLDGVDKQQAKATALASRMALARADYYRAYESYVAVLIGEFGAYQVVKGQFVFPFQRAADRYNAAAQAMAVATKHIAELEEERKTLMQLQQGWEQFVKSE